jgi:MFS family permease
MTDLRPLFTVWGTWLVLMAGANVAAPLYAVYAAKFGFSSRVLTAIFTTYAVVLVPTLLVFGRVSDRFGRRPVIVAGIVAAAVGLVVFAAAQTSSGSSPRAPSRGSPSAPSAARRRRRSSSWTRRAAEDARPCSRDWRRPPGARSGRS